jgi:hypothetical protein
MQRDDYFQPIQIVANSITTGYGAAVNDVLMPLKVIKNLPGGCVRGWNVTDDSLKLRSGL